MSELDWLLLGVWFAFALACWAMRLYVKVGDDLGSDNPHESHWGDRP